MDDLKSLNHLSEQIIGAAIEVHKHLGPGLLESAYEASLFYELHTLKSMMVQRQVPTKVQYKGQNLDVGYRMDLIVEDQIIIELKSVDTISDVHLAQMLTYLKLSGKHLGLIINYNVKLLKNGIKRVLHNI